MHLWDDERGYTTFPYRKYAYKKDPYGQYRSMYGDKLSKIGKWEKDEAEDLFESDVPETTRVLVDIYESDLPSKGHRTMTFDIEVEMITGLPNTKEAQNEITAIAAHDSATKMFDVFVLDKQNKIKNNANSFSKDGREVNVHIFNNEKNLLHSFLNYYEEINPTILTGWNIDFFDIPYLYNRIKNVCGEGHAKRLSPIGQSFYSPYRDKWQFGGVSILDYINLYKTYTYTLESSYTLNHIATKELGRGKVEYEGSLDDLFENDSEKFIEYNIVDVELIVELEAKLKLIELSLTLSYDTKSNYGDVFTQTRMWDAIIYNYLLERNIVVPPNETSVKDGAFEGAYVKDPQIGVHDYVASFDLNSLYPHLMMQYNISPETIIEVKDYDDNMRQIISDGVSVDKMLSKEVDTSKLQGVTITPNGQFFRTTEQGFLPKMLEEMYVDRSKFKKLMLKAKQEYENEKDESKKNEINNRIARYDNLQLAKKVSLNSAYGALGSQYFRFYDLRMALAVTLAGQLSIRWIEKHLNSYMNNLLKTEEDYVIASDTDSIYLKLGSLVDKVHKDKTDINKIIAFMDQMKRILFTVAWKKR